MNYKQVIFSTGGKQITAKLNEEYYTEKIIGNVGDTVFFTNVLAVFSDEAPLLATPKLDKVVTAVITKQGKSKKVIIFKYKPKKNYKVKHGHRQPYTKVQITGVISEQEFKTLININSLITSDFVVKVNDVTVAPKVIKKPTVIESVTPEKAAVVSKKPKTSTITSTKSVAESHLRTEMYDDNLKAIYDDKNLTVKFVKVNEEEDKSTKKITPPKAKKTPK